MIGIIIGVVLVITYYIGKILSDIEDLKYEIKLLRNAIFELQKPKKKDNKNGHNISK